MKKWYALVGVLVVALGISLGTCSLTGAQLDEFRSDYYDVSEELEANESELSDVRGELDDVKSELMHVKGVKELTFGKGLRLFDLGWKEGYWGILEGKVENVGDKSMPSVRVLVVSYKPDGTLDDVDSDWVSDLFPGEVADWSISGIFLEDGQRYEEPIEGVLGIYAFGNR